MIATLRELARSVEAWFVALFCPAAAAAQFLGQRPVVVVALSVAFVAVCAALALSTMWRRAARLVRARAAEQQLIADHLSWLKAHDERRAQRHRRSA